MYTCNYNEMLNFNLFIFIFGELQDCQLSVRQVNPRQYVAEIPQVYSNFAFSKILNTFVTELHEFAFLPFQQLLNGNNVDFKLAVWIQ